MLSRQASAAASKDKYNDALSLMRESIAAAQQIPNFTRDTLLALHCKLTELMLMSGRRREALDLANEYLKSLNVTDWRELLVAFRLMEVQRECLMHLHHYDSARAVSVKMNELEERYIDNHFECVKRRVRTVEIDFARKDFSRVISEVKQWHVFDHIEKDNDPNLNLLMAYTGISLMATGKTEEGRQMVAKSAGLGGKPGALYLAEWAERTLDSMSNSAEIYKLLKR